MSETAVIPVDEQEALEYVACIKGFYMHAFMFAVFAIVFLGTFGIAFGFERPPVSFLPFAFAGWAIGGAWAILCGLATAPSGPATPIEQDKAEHPK